LNFFGARERNARSEHVEMALFHPRQQSAVRTHKSPQRGAAVGIDLAYKRDAFFVKAPGAFRFEFEQRLYTLRERTLQIVLGAPEPLEIFLRQIDAAHFEVSFHVANDIRQLKCKAQAFREVRIARIAKTENVQTCEAHCSCHAIAIFRKLVERRIGRNG